MTILKSRTARIFALSSLLAASGLAVAQTPPAPNAPPASPAPNATPASPAPAAPPTPAPTPAPNAPSSAPAPSSPPAANPPATPPQASTAPDDSSTVQSIEIKARPALVVADKSSWEDGYKSITAALAKVRDAAAKNGLTATGHPVTAFVDTDDNGFKFEAMLPVDKTPDGKTDLGNGVRVGATPAGKALKFQHRGAYEDIDTTYEAITAYLDEKGLEAQNVFVEEYLKELKSPDDTGAEVDIYVLIK